MNDLAYLVQEGLDRYFELDSGQHSSPDPFWPVRSASSPAFAPEVADLARLHRLIRLRRSFTVVELGVGYSTLVIADALRKNRLAWDALSDKPALRNRYMFQCFTVDSSAKWLSETEQKFPAALRPHVTFHHSPVHVGTHQGQLCHFYDDLPDVVPDFIYIDGPDPKDVQGSINGLSFQCDERTVMSGDLLLMEPTLLPGTFVLIDGRTNNARFLANNLRRNFVMNWDGAADITTFELVEERLGPFNILGSDFPI